VVFGILALAGCSSEEQTAAPPSAAARDVRLLVERIEAIHPNPWHAISAQEFKFAAEKLERRIDQLTPDEQLVELMRLTALLGERDGHSGIFPLDETHDRTPHLYPIRLYEFSDGLFVVDAIDHPELVGARLVSIGGHPVDEIMAAVRPLVPADNEWSLKARLPQYLVSAEVLRGLGYASAEFAFDRLAATLEPVEAGEYATAFPDLFHPMVPQGLPHAMADQVVEMLDGGRVVYAAYNVTLGETTDFADDIGRRARRAQRVVIDLRNNPGGNNGTYPPLLEALKPLDVVALIGRTTFSAAANFITELERTGDVLFVGEPSGGAPNQYGDPVAVPLPATGWTAHIAGVYWEKSTPDDSRLAIVPEIPVELSSEDFFADRDPVLSTALRPTLR
jgi:hypothetical protein